MNQYTLYKSDSRGMVDHGWLKTAHSFSFANYYNPNRMNFGTLRVINDDHISPSTGFDLHPHDNMEIITIVLAGEIRHEDSMGHKQVIYPNEVQVMSAGSGIYHAEYNNSDQTELSLFQVWIYPNTKNIKPSYNQQYFEPSEANNQWQYIVAPQKDKTLSIQQEAVISRTFLAKGEKIIYKPQLKKPWGSYLQNVSGKQEVNAIELNTRDAVGIIGQQAFEITALEDSHLINFEVTNL